MSPTAIIWNWHRSLEPIVKVQPVLRIQPIKEKPRGTKTIVNGLTIDIYA